MLLKHLEQVAEIDDMINQIHEELVDLYRERAHLMGTKPGKLPTLPQAVARKRSDWTAEQYENLKMAWAQYDISIPAYATLKKRLQKARTVIEKLTKAEPTWKDKLQVVLVPPTSKLQFPVQAELRMKQDWITTPDYVDALLHTPKATTWQVMVVYGANEGLYMGSPEMMLNKKNSKVANYDITKLGVREYAAFSLQNGSSVDTQTWTVLPKQRLSDGKMACVAYIDGQYRFDVDEVNGVFGDNRFRPAIEVK